MLSPSPGSVRRHPAGARRVAVDLPREDGRCEGGEFVLVNITGVTLVDTLDTLALMGNAASAAMSAATLTVSVSGL